MQTPSNKDFSKCPRCGSELRPAIAMNGGESEFWLECTRCNAFVNTYMPQPHQSSVHEDPHRFIGNFGGYGTGKTLTSRQELYKHIFLTPNANVLVSANISSQYEQTIKRDIEADLPAFFIKKINTQKSYWDFINGARVMFRPLDDVDKIRSYNLTMFIIIEASEVDEAAFTQLKTRLRNLNAAVPELDEEGKVKMRTLENGTEVPIVRVDWMKGIIESNPDAGWIRSEVLYVSDKIYTHGRTLEEVEVTDDVRDPAISSHIASTDCNAFLPPGFVETLCTNKPSWWINRYIYSSFSYAEGLVYPTALTRVCNHFKVPDDWKRIVAADYGLSDDFVYLYGAIDEKDGIIYIYKEERTNNKNIEELARLFHESSADIPVGGFYTAPILDPKSGAKRDYNKKTLYDHFLDYGIAFQPGAVSVDARVYRTNTYLESGRLRIMDNCVGLIDELKDYRFPPKSLTAKTSKSYDKPMDKNNHAINPLEWICMALPADPSKLYYGVYDQYGNDLSKERASVHSGIPPQLQDDDIVYDPYTFTEW